MAIKKVTEEIEGLLAEYKGLSPFKTSWDKSKIQIVFPQETFDEWWEEYVQPLVLSTYTKASLKKAVRFAQKEQKYKEDLYNTYNTESNSEMREHTEGLWKTLHNDFEKQEAEYMQILESMENQAANEAGIEQNISDVVDTPDNTDATFEA